MLPEGFRAMAGTLPGLDTDAFLAAMETAPSVGIRLNPLKPVASFPWAGYSDVQPVEWCAEGARLPERPVFTLNPLLHAGAFYVQDPSSMIYAPLTEKALSLLPPEVGAAPYVLDMCASPGGKTSAMMSRLPREAVVVANEYVAQRIGALRENMAKWGWSRLLVCNSDSADFANAGELFDIIAVDAPCSGEGMMRKDEDARAQWSPSLVEQCSALQREILANAVKALRPGGVLIYSTCTFNLDEDERNAAYIVSDLGLEPVDSGLSGIGGILPQLEGDIPALRFMPHATDGEGLFVAIFRKPGESPAHEIHRASSLDGRKDKKGKKVAKDDGKRSAVPLPEVGKWLEDESGWRLFPDRSGTLLEALPGAASPLNDSLSPFVRIVGRGITAAELKGKEWAPASELVLSCAWRRDVFPYTELPEEEALRYLRREALALEDVPKGYVAVGYRGVPLGLVKNIGKRANNLYLSRWKIKFL